MKFKYNTILGLAALGIMVTLSLRHAHNNYGILDGNLPLQVLAQTNNSGGGTTGDGGGTTGDGGGTTGCGTTGNGDDSSGNGDDSSGSGDDSSSGNQCPDYNYVPNRYIEHELKTVTVTSNSKGEISIGDKVKGGFEKNKQIVVAYQISNCSGVQPGSCCNQSNTGVKIL